jgi:hypothetical protein
VAALGASTLAPSEASAKGFHGGGFHGGGWKHHGHFHGGFHGGWGVRRVGFYAPVVYGGYGCTVRKFIDEDGDVIIRKRCY